MTTPKKNRTALIMAGGTGGHIFPALALADELKAHGWRIVWLGAEGGMETRIVPERGYPIKTLNIKGLRRNGVLGWLKLPWTLSRALLRCLGLMLTERPDIAIGFGGYTGFAGGITTRFCLKPLIIHEQNAIAGLTNRVLSRIATRTLSAFPSAFPQHAQDVVGNPVRDDILRLPPPETRFYTRTGALRILVVGGSLGAQAFNDIVPQALALLPADQRPTVIHQAGVKHLDALNAAYAKAHVHADTRAFIHDMAAEYAAADLVICRAGALTIAELAAAGCASILVPYPHAVDDHQTLNAQFLTHAHAAILLPQAQLTPTQLAQYLCDLSRETCLKMASNARQLAQPNATQRIAEICCNLTE